MRTSAWLLAAAIISITLGSGCTHEPPRTIIEPLPLPARPALPALTEQDMQCLSDDAYRRLVERDRLRREYAEELEAIIRATREEIH